RGRERRGTAHRQHPALRQVADPIGDHQVPADARGRQRRRGIVRQAGVRGPARRAQRNRPLSALPILVSVMVAFVAEVVNDDVPATVKAPVCVRFPTVSVTVRLPPTFEAPSTVALALVSCALPLAPLLLSVTAPVSGCALA